MWWGPSIFDFKKDEAEKVLADYNKLSTYLYKFVDLEQDYSVFNQRPIAQWIKEKGLSDGNVVCLYFFIRNFLEKSGKSVNIDDIGIHPDVKECLDAILVCLQRVAYDVLHHYALFQSPSVLNSYNVMKSKLYYLLTTYLPCGKNLSKLSSFSQSHENAIDRWHYKKNNGIGYFESIAPKSDVIFPHRDWTKNWYPCRWLEAFGWSHYTSYGITFGPIPQGLKVDQDSYLRNADKVYKAMLKCFDITTITSWDEFFQKFEFPLTQQEIEKALKLSD